MTLTKRFIVSIFVIVFLASLFVNVNQGLGVTLTSLPFKDEGAFSGFSWTAVSDKIDTKYNALTEGSNAISLPIKDLEFKRNLISVDLSGTNVISNIDGAGVYIEPVIANDTWESYSLTEGDATSPNPTVSGPSASESNTKIDFSMTTASGINTTNLVTSRFYAKEDLDGDGVFNEAGLGEKHYWRSVSSTTILYFNIQFNTLAADTGYVYLRYVFKTTSGTYNVTVQFNSGSGDTAWSNLGSSSDSLATWNIYDVVSGVTIAEMIPMADLLTDDIGDSPSIQGLDQIELGLYNPGNASTTISITVRNLAFFDSSTLVGITDNTDGDSDYDYANANGVPENIWDDTDLLVTKITEGATESFDYTVPLEDNIVDGSELAIEFRKIKFTGEAVLTPRDIDVQSESSGNNYLVTVSFVFYTLELNDIKTSARLPTWSNFYHNLTIETDYLADTTDLDLNFKSYVIDNLDKLDTFQTIFIGHSDSDEVQFDITDPSSTTGASQSIEYSFLSPVSISYSAPSGAAVEGEQGLIDKFFGFIDQTWQGIVALVTAVAVWIGIKKKTSSS